jgi:hypothetical protein
MWIFHIYGELLCQLFCSLQCVLRLAKQLSPTSEVLNCEFSCFRAISLEIKSILAPIHTSAITVFPIVKAILMLINLDPSNDHHHT